MRILQPWQDQGVLPRTERLSRTECVHCRISGLVRTSEGGAQAQEIPFYQNCTIGSQVTVVLLKGWILPISGVASERVCSCSLRSRLVSLLMDLRNGIAAAVEPSPLELGTWVNGLGWTKRRSSHIFQLATYVCCWSRLSKQYMPKQALQIMFVFQSCLLLLGSLKSTH